MESILQLTGQMEVMLNDAIDNMNFRAVELAQPFSLYKPRIARDGDAWIACLGDNIQEGVVGVGDSPANAAHDFNRAWFEKGK